MEGIWWFGYKHENGSLHVKRYGDEKDYEEARDSDFVDQIYGPWPCDRRDQAQEILRKEVLEE